TADDDATALELVKLGLDQARRLGTPQLLAHGLTILGELSRANGDPEQAEAAYREALDLDARLGDRHYEAVNTLNTGHALMAQGRMRDALPYYRYGIELATGIGSRLMMSWNLAGLANAFHLLGWPELSARLIGTAQTTLERLGASHGPVDQPLQDRRQQVLRDDLGSDVYETLVAQGRELTLDEGIELALEALEQQSV
ncbi:MAG: tetratricopeptide repeat protein, partial [Actinomycetota bacterium]